jgi:hypothetical protein
MSYYNTDNLRSEIEGVALVVPQGNGVVTVTCHRGYALFLWRIQMNEVKMQAKFDQINACHRDALDAFRRFAVGLSLLPEDEQNEIVSEMTPMECAVLRLLATEAGNKRLEELFGEEKDNG